MATVLLSPAVARLTIGCVVRSVSPSAEESLGTAAETTRPASIAVVRPVGCQPSSESE
jgi:hypothetical protein